MKISNSASKVLSTSLLFALLLQSCSTKTVTIGTEEKTVAAIATVSVYNGLPLLGYSHFTPLNRYSLMPRYQNFQNRPFPKQSFIIANMISVVQPEMNEEKRDEMAAMIAKISKKFSIRPEIFVSIIDTESNFQTGMVSSTGDLSLAQINVEVWNKEFARMNLPGIDKQRVVSDLEYSLTFMAEILSVLKTRYADIDPLWYARYHSSTPKYKYEYFKKLDFRMDLISRNENLRNQIAQIQNIEFLSRPNVDHVLASLEFNNTILSILTPEPMPTKDKLYTSAQSKAGTAIEYAKNFVFDVLKF